MEQVKPEEVEAWLQHPVTKAFRQSLRNWRQDLMEQWAMGQFQSEGAAATAVANGQGVAEAQLLKRLDEEGMTTEKINELLTYE